MMKKLLLPMALGALLAANVSAGTVTLSDAAGRVGSGGEFTATTSENGVFLTFCIEHNENITLPGTYNYVVSGGAIQGGVAGGNPDPISIGTAYLYRNFHDGTLYNTAAIPVQYTHITQQQLDLQEAIWWLEEEITLTTTQVQANQYLKKAYSVIGGASDYSDLRANGNGAYQVYAMNLTTQNGGIAQDQLIVVPEGGMTLAMLGMACASFGLMRRKF